MDGERPEAGGLIVPASRVKVSTGVVRVGPPQSSVSGPQPTIQVIHQDDAIRMIQIVCTCGERICIRCDYE